MSHHETHFLQLNRANRHDTLVLSRTAGAPGESSIRGGWNRSRAERTTPTLQTAFGRAAGQDTQVAIMRLALATRHRVERPAMSMEGGTDDNTSYGAVARRRLFCL